MKAMINKLSAAQRKLVQDECKKEFNRLVSNYNKQAALQVLHILYFAFDFSNEQLKRFAEKLTEMQDEAVNRYEITDGEVPDVCEIHLRDAGVNIDELLGG